MKFKGLVIVLALFCFIASGGWVGWSQSNSSLGTLAASMQGGTWAQLSTNNISPTLQNTGGTDNMIFTYADSMVWDSVSHQAFYIGSDHGGTLGWFGFRLVNYAESTNAWSILTQPSYPGCVDSSNNPCGDAHGYESTAIDVAARRLYRAPYGTRRLYYTSLDSPGTFTQTAPPPFVNDGSCCTDAIVNFPELGGIVDVRPNDTVYLYNTTSNAWRLLSSNNFNLGYWAPWVFAVYNPVQKVVLFGDGGSNLLKLSSTGQVTRLNSPPATIYNGSGFNGLVSVDPVSGDYLVLTVPPRQLYVYNVVNDAWRAGPQPPAILDSATAVVQTPVNSYGVILMPYCKASSGCGTLLYKHSSSGGSSVTTPPTVSMTSPANGTVVSGTVTLSATASGAAAIAGVQFKLDGSNLGTQASTSPYSVSWDTSTASAGTHTLTAVVLDVVGDLVASSPVSVTVNSSSADTTPPTVSVNSPTKGALVSGTISVSATATDNAAVAGVQFKLDGNNLGLEVTSAPYGVSWDTTTAGAGTHTLTAIARDPAGNMATSSPVSVTVSGASTSSQPGSQVTSFQLTSAISGTAPFTVGIGFKQGDVPGFPVLDVATSQVIVKSRWSDNSVKHAIASGRIALTAGVPATIHVSSSSSAPTTANLTASDIQAANPSASVQLGSVGSVNLSNLLATPFRTWISGPEMVEAHYRSAVGSDTNLVVWFHVRLYKSGQMWIRAIVDNGFLDVTHADKSYVPTVIINGSTVYNNGGSALSHYANTRWSVEAWTGTDPQVTPQHDTTYLISTRLVPNYWKRNPSSTALNALIQTYSPMGSAQWTPDMGNTGFQDQIGILPLWDALYITSGADSRAYKSVLANAKAINSYKIIWPSSTSGLTPRPTDFSNWTLFGPNGGGGTAGGAGSLNWDYAHHGSAGYLAYLITGDYLYLEAMAEQSSVCYLATDQGQGLGTSRWFQLQTRGVAWCNRTVGQYASIAPTGDAIASDYGSLLAGQATHWNSVISTPGINPLGYIYSYELGSNVYGTGNVSAWQQHFWVQTYGHISDLQPFSDMTSWNTVRNWLYKSVVGTLGPSGSGNYCFTMAGSFSRNIVGSVNADPTSWYTSWETVYKNTDFGAAAPAPPNTACGNTLLGSPGGADNPTGAATGYWGNMLPALAYAVDHGASGASDAWNRLTGAVNWSSVENSGFDNTPTWGIVPRAPGSSTPSPGGSVTTSVLITAPTNAATISGTSVSVVANASSTAGIAGVQFKLDGANLAAEKTTAPYTITWDTTQVANGSHVLTAVARDTTGSLTTSVAVSVTVSNNNSLTTVSITAPNNSVTVSGTSVTVSANASSAAGIAGVQFKLDGTNLNAEKTAAPFTIIWDTTQVSNGAHTLTAVARDTAGNQTTSAAVVITVNNVPPTTISITAPANGGTVNGTSVAVSANATNSIGIAGVQFKLDGSNLGSEKTTAPYTMTWDTTQAANGSHVLTAVARDTAGNLTISAAVFITINNVSPTTVSITAPGNGSTVSGTSVTISANASNAGGIAGVQFKLDGVNLGAEQTAAPYSIPWNTSQTPNGSHILTAVARDLSGNFTTSSPVTVTVTNGLDTTPPTVSITSPLANATVSGSAVSISASASDNVGVAGVQFKVDGINLGAEQTGTTYTIFWDTTQTSNGNHSLTALARDSAGNQTTSGAVAVKVSNNATGNGGGTASSSASVAYSLSDRGTNLLTENSTSGSITVGYARVQTDSGSTALGGAAIFSYHAGGAVVSETSVPLSPLVQSGRMYVEQKGPVSTGVAFANPNNQDASISFYFTDTAGNDFASGSFTLGANRQKAQFLNEGPFFFPNNTEGTLTFTSSIPVSMVALRGLTNERSIFLMSTLPVPSLDTSNASPLAVLPHFAIGAGWTTKIILVNPTDGFLSGTAQFFSPAIGDAAVSPMVVHVNGVAASGLNYAIPGHSEYAVNLDSVDGNLASGSIRITAINGSVAPSGLAIFSFTNNGVTVSEASVPIAPPALALRVYVDSHGTPGAVGSSQTGIALVNPTASAVKVNLDLTGADGTAVGTPTSFMIPPGGQIAKFLNELIPDAPTTFNGVLRASSAGPIAGIGLRLTTNDGGDYVMSTIPAVTETQNGAAQLLMFPHIVSGGGFTTELILLNRQPSTTSSGKVIFAGQDGSPLSIQ